MGIQYADLPRISTAGIEAGARATDALGQSLDRMINFAYQRRVTDAERKAKEYAIKNPLSQQQVQDALETGTGVKVPGGGRIFQQTYQKVQANILATDLKMEANKTLTAVNAAIQSGQAFNLEDVETQIRDMIDGYTATIMALDPDQGLQFKASVTAAGNKIYQTAANQAIKIDQAARNAEFELGVRNARPVLEAIYATAGSIDPDTGKPVDIDALIEIERQPFLNSVAITGNNVHLNNFNKEVSIARTNALVGFMSDRDNAETAPQAIRRMQAGDFGDLSGVFKNLTQDEKAAVEKEVMASFSRQYTAETQQAALERQEAQERWNTVALSLLNPGTSESEKRNAVAWGVANNMITVQTANALLRPEPGTGDVVLEAQINDAINRRTITTLDELYQYRGQLTESQFQSAARNLTSKQHSFANTYIRNAAGVTEQAWITPQRNNEYQAILEIYENVLQEQVPNAQGVMVNISPLEAARRAVAEHKGNPQVSSAKTIIEQNQDRITNILQANGINIPQNVALEDLDVTKMRGLSGPEKQNVINAQQAIRNQTPLVGPNRGTR
jgi:hypothetical protein